MIARIVGRCHVGDSDLTVVRYVLTRLKGRRGAFLRLPREDRRYLVQTAIAAHRANQSLYRAVLRGF